MLQELLITDLTRMRDGKVCIAGLNSNLEAIRPELPSPGIMDSTLYQGDRLIIYPRAVVRFDLKPLDPKKLPSLPHVEDRPWMRAESVEFLRETTVEKWRNVLERISFRKVFDAFGAPIIPKNKLQPGTGERSLACIAQAGAFKLTCVEDKYHQGKFDYRLMFKDDGGDGAWYAHLPVTDLALRAYVEYCHLKKGQSLEDISRSLTRIMYQRETFIRLGLTRPFQKSRYEEEFCYLQVNGVHTFPDYLEGRTFADFRLD
jgi:hypothetical protein